MVNFNEIAIKWFEAKKRMIRPSSLSVYHSKLFGHLIPYFSKFEIITNQEVQEFVIELTEKGLSKRTITDNLIVLENILKYGEDNGYETHFVFDVVLPTILNSRIRQSKSFTIVETRKLRAYLFSNPETGYNLAILICLSCGLRIGECTGLKFLDFDFKRKMLSVSRTSHRINVFDENNMVVRTKINIGPPKTKSSKRNIPVSDDILDLVKNIMIGKTPEDYVFKSKYTSLPVDTRILRDCFNKVLVKIGLPRIVFHGLRHSFASNCIASDIDVKTTSSLLGHSDVKMTLDIYTHPSVDQKKAAINKLGKLFG